MRVLVIGLTGFVGGIETYLLNLMSLIGKDERFDFDFLIKGFDKALCEDELRRYIKPWSRFYYVKNYRQSFVVCIKALSRIYKKNYDIVYLNSSFSSDILFVLPYIDHSKTRVVMHSHTSLAEERGWQSKLFRGVANKWVDCRIACSVKAGDWLYGSGHRDFIHIIRNGIDTDRFKFSCDKRAEIRTQYGISKNTLLVGHVGRFSPPKNHFYILRIVRECMKKGMDVRFMLLGNGDSYDEVVSMAKDMGIDTAIIFAGVHNNTEAYYSAFDLFILPSLYEGLPFVGVEAQASGLPCYFSDKVDQDSIITDKCGTLPIAADNVVDWTEAIEQVKCNFESGYYRNRENYAAVVAEKGFDKNIMAEKVAKLLMNVVSGEENQI